MKKTLTAILFLFLTTGVFAQVKNTIAKSSITFQIKNLGINTSGQFGGLTASFQFDPANLPASAIEATVDANTLNTNNDTKDKHLKSDDYFDVARFPKIVMKSVSFKHKSGDNYVGIFNLTLKDKTKPVEVPFTYTETGGTAMVKGSFKIDRTDYGVGGKSMILSSDVIVTIDLEIAK